MEGFSEYGEIKDKGGIKIPVPQIANSNGLMIISSVITPLMVCRCQKMQRHHNETFIQIENQCRLTKLVSRG